MRERRRHFSVVFAWLGYHTDRDERTREQQLSVLHTYYVCMAHSDVENETTGPEKTKINLRLSERLLADVDEIWEEQGYNSRSEYLRQAIRDSVHGRELSARTLESLLVSERQRERGETVSSAEMRERYLTVSIPEGCRLPL